jgi:hypothetical protein
MKYGASLTAVCWAVLGAKHKDVYPEMRAGMLESGLLNDVPPGYANPVQAELYLKDATARGNIQASVILYKLNLNSSIPGFAAKAPAVRAAGEAYRNKLSETCKSVGFIASYDRLVKENYKNVQNSQSEKAAEVTSGQHYRVTGIKVLGGELLDALDANDFVCIGFVQGTTEVDDNGQAIFPDLQPGLDLMKLVNDGRTGATAQKFIIAKKEASELFRINMVAFFMPFFNDDFPLEQPVAVTATTSKLIEDS